jgi:hypothetical protein
MKKIFLLTIIAIALVFVNCKKIEEVEPQLSNGEPILKTHPQGEAMLVFNNFDELFRALNKTSSYTLEELDQYEAAKGFNSFGKLAEKAMQVILNKIEQQSISQNDALQAVINNSEFLQIVTKDGKNHCETKYYLSPFINVMNRNGMFQVDTLCYKVFENGHVYCHADYYDALLNLTESDFAAADVGGIASIGDYGMFSYSSTGNSDANGYGKKFEKCAENGTERVYVKVEYGEGMRRSVAGCVRVDMGFLRATTWGKHKWAGTWWASNRTNSQDIRATLWLHNSSVSDHTSGKKSGYKIEQYFCEFSKTFPQGVSQPDIYISWLSGWGKIPAVTCYIP